MDKPTKPTDLMPRSFGGVKNNFSANLQNTGFEDGVPTIYGGDNLNYQLDATGKELDYCEKIVDFVNGLPIGKVISTDSNNKLVYENLSTVGKTGSYNDLTNKPTIPSVDNLANKDLSNLTTTGNNKILPTQAGNSGKYLTTNGTTPSWTNFTGANQDLSNLSDKGNNRLHALKGYEDNGELLTDAEGLTDIKSYAHSTFDLSKFTVVGSPTITSDGIASGFSSSNYITIPQLNSKPDKLEIIIKLNVSNCTFENNMLLNWSDNFRIIYRYGFNYLLMVNRYNGTDKYVSTPISMNKDYVVRYVITSTNCKVYLDDELITDSNGNFDLSYVSSNACMIGRGAAHTGWYWQGFIDLKYFSILTDGVEVFSGNKTGIDTIKPDDYTVVGSPTISDDGVASGFTNTSYLSAPSTLSLSVSNSAVIRLKFKLNGNQASDNAGSLYAIYGTPYNLSTPVISANSTRIDLYSGITSSQTNFYTCEVGKWYILEEVFTSTTKTTNIYDLNNNLLKTQNFVLTQTLNLTDIIIRLCGNPSTNRGLTAGVIDLNAFKVYLDGNLVYQPCLKIPYTQSKTGSKIVDSYYRNRVSDMYEQFGCAPYYTLQKAFKGNYNVIGNPTISGNGIISTSNASNYVETSNNLDLTKPFKIQVDFSYNYSMEGYVIGSPAGYADNSALFVWVKDFVNLVIVNSSQSTVAQSGDLRPAGGLVIGTTYRLYVEFTGSSYIFRLINPVTNQVLSEVIRNTTATTDRTKIRISGTLNNGNAIDLKTFTVTIAGDAAYNAVILPNFTLPMGELYGMIERNASLSNNQIGLPIATLSNTLNDNEIWLEGAEVSKKAYAKLYAIYGDNYGTPDVNTNFVLPNFTDRVMQGISSGTAFGYIGAGLPNITGGFASINYGTRSGAFERQGADIIAADGGGGMSFAQTSFDASRSSSIYGNSTTVQPPAIKVRVKTRYI